MQDALASQRLAGAAFDVFAEEPPTDRKLLAMDSFVGTPHIGGGTTEAVLAMGRAAMRDSTTRPAKSVTSLIRCPASADRIHGGNCQVERKTISIMKACELVGVSRRTIYNWLSSGKIDTSARRADRCESLSTPCGAVRMKAIARRRADVAG